MKDKSKSELKHVWDVISHDFATPLTVLDSYMKQLQQYMPTLIEAYHQARDAGIDLTAIRPDRLKLLTTLPSECLETVRYLSLYSDRLDQKLSLNSLTVKKKVVSIIACFNKAFDTFVAQHGLTDYSRICIDLQSAKVIIDPDVFHFVLLELLANADYYLNAAGRNSRFMASATVDEKFYKLQLMNTDFDIASDDLPHIFERYFSGRRKIGLGLYFCRETLLKMGCDISCDSGNNSVSFIVKLPIAKES